MVHKEFRTMQGFTFNGLKVQFNFCIIVYASDTSKVYLLKSSLGKY